MNQIEKVVESSTTRARFKKSAATRLAKACIRVLVVGDHTLVRQGFYALLRGADGIELIGEVGDGATAIEAVERLAPDVVLIDVMMTRTDIAATVRGILVRCPGTKFVALSNYGEHLIAALRAGSLRCVSMTESRETFLETIRQIGDARAAQPVMGQRLSVSSQERRPLSPREVEILREVAMGRRNVDIGLRLYISEATVRSHITSILSKLGVDNRVEATLCALRDGLITLNECLDSEN